MDTEPARAEVVGTPIRDPILKQGFRFLIFGGLTSVIGFAVFIVLETKASHQVHYMGAWLISMLVGLAVGFSLQRTLVFKAKGRVWADFVRFTAVNASSTAFNAVALPLLVDGLNVRPIVSQCAITATTTIYNFLAHRVFTFARPADKVVPATELPDGD